ncbi:MAG: hypothetical protein H6765_10060 [Candidatus Peribacteria bacterium]|nr:MAG: hypothetical protein H6765_10060 [Candidatus Peribacteria bacterium]
MASLTNDGDLPQIVSGYVNTKLVLAKTETALLEQISLLPGESFQYKVPVAQVHE